MISDRRVVEISDMVSGKLFGVTENVVLITLKFGENVIILRKKIFKDVL